MRRDWFEIRSKGNVDGRNGKDRAVTGKKRMNKMENKAQTTNFIRLLLFAKVNNGQKKIF
jgi:hypothetical protein